jgi:hypothetical protein
MKRFNITKWEAATYNTCEEIEKAVADFGIIGKKLKKIQPIGEVHINLDFPINYNEYYDWRLKLHEPVVFTFEDNSTFEIMPTSDGLLRMNVNTKPIYKADGKLKSNFNPKPLFSGTYENQIESFAKLDITRTIPMYILRLGNYRITVSHHLEHYDYYDLWMTYSGRPDKVLGVHIAESFDINKYSEIEIIPGRNRGGSFNFHIVSAEHEKAVGIYPYADESWNDLFDITEEETADFLFPFLQKHIAEDVQRELLPEPIYEYEGLEYWGWNYYTFAQVRAIIADLREAAELLKTEPYEKAYPDLYARFFDRWGLGFNYFAYKHERREFLKTCVPDFYERIALRLEKMITEAPEGFEHICVEGP